MAPSVSTDTITIREVPATKAAAPALAKNTLPGPLKSSGSLDKYDHFESTVVIGTEFSAGSVQLADLLDAPNSDDLIRDLAILVSQRGVVFFRKQKLDLDQQRKLGDSLGRLTGKPETSGLHIHPLTQDYSELGSKISVISSKEKQLGDASVVPKKLWDPFERSKLASAGWHADITFEKVPSDYAILKVVSQPPTGGDTIWASGYEVYDRLSPAYRQFLEGLSAVHNADRFNTVAEKRGFKLRDNRGAPQNVGEDLTAVHPVVRTNPVTGWKSIFVNRGFTRRILGLTRDESDHLIDYLTHLTSENHDLQVRFKWNQYADEPEYHDVAIWDNRSVNHTATDDYFNIEGAARSGDRVVSLGETPYYSAESSSRRAALGLSQHGGQRF